MPRLLENLVDINFLSFSLFSYNIIDYMFYVLDIWSCSMINGVS